MVSTERCCFGSAGGRAALDEGKEWKRPLLTGRIVGYGSVVKSAPWTRLSFLCLCFTSVASSEPLVLSVVDALLAWQR